MIEVCNISKEFIVPKKYPGLKGAIKGLVSNEKERKLAVDDVSFNIKKGEVVGFIGSNGAGKSTTIKMLTGIMRPTKGYCIVNGISPQKERLEHVKNIGVVFGQKTQLWWDLPLHETFVVLKEIYSISDSQYKDSLDFLNEVLNIGELMKCTVRTLSLGQRMRADIAAALLHNPKVLFLDEPTIGLDVLVKDKIRNAINGINKESKTTVILTTHDMEDIEMLCKRIIIMDKGRVIYNGSIDDVKKANNSSQCLKLTVDRFNAFSKEEFRKYYRLAEEDLDIDYKEGNVVEVFYNNNVIDAAQIIEHFVKFTRVYNFEKVENQLVDVVKKVYGSN